MDFIDELRALAARIPKQLEHLQTEEGTKHALVMPFIKALGYDVFDPTEVTPEFVADVGIKKGEKVDYVVKLDGKPIILFEYKGFNADLDRQQPTQLYRYFSVCEARFAVLTSGIAYRFFTDLEEPNKLDLKPFFEFNMLNITDPAVEELKRFTKPAFNLEQNLNAAVELKYTKEIKRILAEQLGSPSDEFVQFFARQVYSGRMTTAIRQQFADITKRALHQFINDRISDRLKSALAEDGASSKPIVAQTTVETVSEPAAPPAEREKGLVTTAEELEGFYVVKSILREVIDVHRIHARDTMSYFSVLLDDTNRKPVCRLRFNASQKYLGLFNDNKEEERVALTDLNEIYQYADRLKATVAMYESAKAGRSE